MIIFVSLSRLVRFSLWTKTPWRTMVLLCWSSEALLVPPLTEASSSRCRPQFISHPMWRDSSFAIVQPSGYRKRTWLRMRILFWKTSWALTRLWKPTVLSEFSCLDSSVLLNTSWAKEGTRRRSLIFLFLKQQTVNTLSTSFFVFYEYICVLVCRCILFHSDFRQQCWV